MLHRYLTTKLAAWYMKVFGSDLTNQCDGVLYLTNQVVIQSFCNATFPALFTGYGFSIQWFDVVIGFDNFSALSVLRSRRLDKSRSLLLAAAYVQVTTIFFVSWRDNEKIDACPKLSWHLTYCWLVCCVLAWQGLVVVQSLSSKAATHSMVHGR